MSRYALAGVLFMFASTDKPQNPYLLLYYVHHSPSSYSIDPCSAFGVTPPPLPACWTETKVAWFATPEDALRFLNRKETSALIFNGQTSGTISFPLSETINGNDVIGLYEVKAVNIRQERVGTEKRMMTETVEKQVPKVEWRLRP